MLTFKQHFAYFQKADQNSLILDARIGRWTLDAEG